MIFMDVKILPNNMHIMKNKDEIPFGLMVVKTPKYMHFFTAYYFLYNDYRIVLLYFIFCFDQLFSLLSVVTCTSITPFGTALDFYFSRGSI